MLPALGINLVNQGKVATFFQSQLVGTFRGSEVTNGTRVALPTYGAQRCYMGAVDDERCTSPLIRCSYAYKDCLIASR